MIIKKKWTLCHSCIIKWNEGRQNYYAEPKKPNKKKIKLSDPLVGNYEIGKIRPMVDRSGWDWLGQVWLGRDTGKLSDRVETFYVLFRRWVPSVVYALVKTNWTVHLSPVSNNINNTKRMCKGPNLIALFWGLYLIVRKYMYTRKFVLIVSIIVKQGFPGGSEVKNLFAKQETWVWSQGWENPLGKGMTTHSSILAWRIP